MGHTAHVSFVVAVAVVVVVGVVVVFCFVISFSTQNFKRKGTVF